MERCFFATTKQRQREIVCSGDGAGWERKGEVNLRSVLSWCGRRKEKAMTQAGERTGTKLWAAHWAVGGGLWVVGSLQMAGSEATNSEAASDVARSERHSGHWGGSRDRLIWEETGIFLPL